MRIPFLIVLFVGGAVFANPIPLPPPRGGYIASEKLVVSISSTDATFAASFTFQSDKGTSKAPASGPQAAVGVDLPIWFPEKGGGDPAVEKFWKTFERGNTYDLSTNAVARQIFDNSIGLKIHTSYGGPSKAPDIFKFLTVPGNGGSGKYGGRFRESGFCCLVLPFSVSPYVIWDTPVNIAYRQPLLRSNGEGRFFYLPVFKNLPRGISTADTSRYAITIEATPDCSLTVSNGDRKIRVESGQSVTLFPRHLQPIRAVSKPTPPGRVLPRQRPVVVGSLSSEDIDEIQRVVQHELREMIIPSSDFMDDRKFFNQQVKEYEAQRILWIGVESDGHVEVFAGVSRKAIASEGYTISLWKDPKWRSTGAGYWGIASVRPKLPRELESESSTSP